MRFSINELRSFLDTEAAEREIADTLTSIGLEVEALESQDGIYDHFVIGRVVKVKSHTQSNKLHVCTVDVGISRHLQIICGASNVHDDMKVIVALPSAKIPDSGMIIAKRPVCGVDSEGMLCSWQEIKLEGTDDGTGYIADLTEEITPVATKFSDLLDISTILEVNITPNRGDCTGVYGIARDLAAAGIGVLNNTSLTNEVQDHIGYASDIGNIDTTSNNRGDNMARGLEAKAMKGWSNDSMHCAAEQVHVRKLSNELLPFLAGSEIRQVTAKGTPLCMRRQLQIANMSISGNIFKDLSSIVAWKLGVPICVHDAAKISGDLRVDYAKHDEVFIDVNSASHKLDNTILILRDSQDIPISILGIASSLHTTINMATDSIYIECGYFCSKSIAHIGQKLGIHSDLRFRHERGIDIEMVKTAIHYYNSAIVEICSGKIGYLHCIKTQSRPIASISYVIDNFQRMIHYPMKRERMLEILRGLQFTLEEDAKNPNIINVSPPSYRHDISISEDITEELARINGYQNVPLVPDGELYCHRSHKQNNRNIHYDNQLTLRKLLAGIGYNEVVNFSFIAQQKAACFTDIQDDLIIQNPVNDQMSYMRPTLFAGLLDNISLNINHNCATSLSFFEIGKVFYGTAVQQQQDKLTGVRYGKKIPKTHLTDAVEYSVFDVKSDVYAILEHFGIMPSEQFDASLRLISDEENTWKIYHPYKTFVLHQEDDLLSVPLLLGELHPRLLKKFEIDDVVQFFAIDLHWLHNIVRKMVKYDFKLRERQPLFKNIAFLFKKLPPLGMVVVDIKKVSPYIEHVSVVDIYDISEVDGIVHKSVNFGLVLGRCDESFTAKEINALFGSIVHLMQTKYSATLRGNITDEVDHNA